VDKEKTKEQLIAELEALRSAIAEMEINTSRCKKAEEKLQKKLIEYEKLSALGRLTANVAHEIRNPIMVIGGFTERLKKTIPSGSKEREYLDMISLESRRLEEVLRDVLTFSNKPFFLKKQEDINKLVTESLMPYLEACKLQVINVQKCLTDVTRIYIDSRYIKEAIRNLISNAIDAMPNGGTLTLATKDIIISRKNYVSTRVTDTGAGISEDNLKMIFEPFFTTKVAKHVTGLGLSLTKKIIEGHGGFIETTSKPGEGSTFTLYFPYRAKEIHSPS
jgi:signal transduction histidine kinase